ncbi:FHA domain-containing protein [Bacillus sp. DTU_2020_1000418_1_SI_GHA_SEK_038]|uniref:FHA domain-containing protein n=1 Tax=Bacillus sp. DTU_2020_1000418_1_SI_GHA_SEK_038 TaxID=3077585 RepID=UPI0028E28AD7|nr:FHA domain-containing protein [Bacillus sp. DTU_2020_1000418_1_SI_GHA_SEK_038]WNS77419.1 FHA domain-containing protein [Bacillus sp. DTU_2020_1000418_1_SI_GHA_SEK_038]
MEEVRICKVCGHLNSLDTTFCRGDGCGEDISYLPITNLAELEAGGIENSTSVEKPGADNFMDMQPKTVRMTGIQFVNTASGYEISIPATGGIIGRSGTIQPEHFQSNLYVSNEHARIQLNADGNYAIVDLGSTNGTKLNGQSLLSNSLYSIKRNDYIIFANLEYMVK